MDPRRVEAALLALAPPVRSSAAEARKSASLLDNAEWQALCAWTMLESLSSWVLPNLDRAGIAIPQAIRAQLAAAQTEDLHRLMLADHALGQLAPLVTGPAAPAMILKGRAIERRAYPPHVPRPVRDVDLLVRAGRYAQVVSLLRHFDLACTWTSRSGHIETWSGPQLGVAIELHLRPLCPWRFQGLAQEQAVEAWFAAAEVHEHRLEPAPVDLTAMLAVHLVEGIYTDVRHVVDFAQWIEVVQPDLEAVFARLQQWQAIRAGMAGLATVAPWVDVWTERQRAALTEHMPAGLQTMIAKSMRQLAGTTMLHRRRTTPRWLEALGLAAHLDRPVPWLTTLLPGGPRRPRVDRGHAEKPMSFKE